MSAGLASLFLLTRERDPHLLETETRGRTDALKRVAGEKAVSDGSWLPELAAFSPVDGDQRSPAVLPDWLNREVPNRHKPLCDSASLRLCVGIAMV